MTHPASDAAGSPSTTMTLATLVSWSRHCRSLATWVSSSAMTNRELESETMKATSSALVDG